MCIVSTSTLVRFLWGSGFGGVGAEEDDGAVGGEGEGVGEDVVERGLPPARGAEAVEGPAEAFGADGGGGVEGEDGHLLVGKGAEGACAAEGAEAAVVGEHLDVDARVLLGEGDEVGDVAQRVVLAATRGAENLKVESGSVLHSPLSAHSVGHGLVEVVVVLLVDLDPAVAQAAFFLFGQGVAVANDYEGN